MKKEKKKRGIYRKFIDSDFSKTINFLGTILVIFLTLIQIVSYLNDNAILEITPFDNNGTVSYLIHNDGEVSGKIISYNLCFLEISKKICWADNNGSILSKPLEINPKESKILDTKYKISTLSSRLSNNNYDKWATEFCDNKTCKKYNFEKNLPKETLNQGFNYFTDTQSGTITIIGLPKNISS